MRFLLFLLLLTPLARASDKGEAFASAWKNTTMPQVEQLGDAKQLAEKNLATYVDWELLWELNAESRRLWQVLLQCAQGDGFKARQFYASAKMNCKDGSRNLKDSLRDLHVLLESYILSSKVIFAVQKSKQRQIQEAYTHMPASPLLGQMLLEQTIVFTRFTNICSFHPTETAWTNCYKVMGKNWIDPPFAQAIAINLEEYVAEQAEETTQSFLRPIIDSQGRPAIVDEHFLRVLVNLYALQQFMPADSSFGLWPEAGVHLLFLTQLQFNSFDIHKYLEQRAVRRNGVSIPAQFRKAEEHKELVLAYRKIAENYGITENFSAICRRPQQDDRVRKLCYQK